MTQERKNYKYSLTDGGEIAFREVTPEELAEARAQAQAKLTEESTPVIRTCWNCNGAHTRFLEDLNDGFLFLCAWGCGCWFYQGIDISDYTAEPDPREYHIHA